MKRVLLALIGVSTLAVLGACSAGKDSEDSAMSDIQNSSGMSSGHNMGNMQETSGESNMDHNMSSMEDMEGMNHSGEVPDGMKTAVDPKFPVGSEVILTTDHMKGMDQAKATITGAYDTTIYEVSYKPITGGDPVTNHKWVVQEELKDSGTPAEKGDTVVLEADHMAGMKGAKATVDKVTKGTVYVVDYTPTNGGAEVKNHMWLTEDEMKKE